MADQWSLLGVEFGNCNCAWGCPCQFGSKTTYGNCEAVVGGHIEEGNFNDTRLDGLDWAIVIWWPGEIADGQGSQQIIIDESADPDQREALRKILHGESTAPGSTHFFVYNSTMSKVLETLYRPIELSIDVEARRGRLKIDGIVESEGKPLISAFDGSEVRSRIHLPNGFEYTYAEMANGSTKAVGEIKLDLNDSYSQFNILHMNQDGVIR